MNYYKALNTQTYSLDSYSIIPIRYEDRMDIMKWRNEQIYHLRQKNPLTKEDQERYFEEVIFNLFDQDNPNQILFSFLKNGICIGYGGLVNIKWIDKNAEISFIMKTEFEILFFKKYWKYFLHLIELVAFKDLNFHKIYTYAFDLRPKLYDALLDCDYFEDARLKDQCMFDNKFIDVLIHSKINDRV